MHMSGTNQQQLIKEEDARNVRLVLECKVLDSWHNGTTKGMRRYAGDPATLPPRMEGEFEVNYIIKPVHGMLEAKTTKGSFRVNL